MARKPLCWREVLMRKSNCGHKSIPCGQSLCKYLKHERRTQCRDTQNNSWNDGSVHRATLTIGWHACLLQILHILVWRSASVLILYTHSRNVIRIDERTLLNIYSLTWMPVEVSTGKRLNGIWEWRWRCLLILSSCHRERKENHWSKSKYLVLLWKQFYCYRNLLFRLRGSIVVKVYIITKLHVMNFSKKFERVQIKI